jgi:hypothetical protein
MITPRSGEVLVGTLPKRAASSSWWPRLNGLRRTAPAVIPPLGYQKRPILRRPMMERSRIWIWTSTSFSSKLSWSPSSGWHLKVPPCCSRLSRGWGAKLHRSTTIGQQSSRGTIRRQPIKRSGKKSPKWSNIIGKRQPPSSRQWRALADYSKPPPARVWPWPWRPPQRHWWSEASQGEVTDPSMMFSSEICHPIREGWFLCSRSIAQAGCLAR